MKMCWVSWIKQPTCWSVIERHTFGVTDIGRRTKDLQMFSCSTHHVKTATPKKQDASLSSVATSAVVYCHTQWQYFSVHVRASYSISTNNQFSHVLNKNLYVCALVSWRLPMVLERHFWAFEFWESLTSTGADVWLQRVSKASISNKKYDQTLVKNVFLLLLHGDAETEHCNAISPVISQKLLLP